MIPDFCLRGQREEEDGKEDKSKEEDKIRRKTNKNDTNGKEWCTVNVEKKWGCTERLTDRLTDR